MEQSTQRWPFLPLAGTAFVLLFGSIAVVLLHNENAPKGFPVVETDDACSQSALAASWTVEAPSLERPAGGDIVPVRSVADPYPSLHSVAVDAENNMVLMSDSNRGELLFYDRAVSSGPTSVTIPLSQVRGPVTGMMFVAGVALDAAHREAFAVNNDIGDRMEVFPYGAQGNVKPKRILFVPHGSWGVDLSKARDEIAISVEHTNNVVFFRREASLAEAPLRVLRGPKTRLGDPHGIVVDDTHNEISAANHGNWAPMTRAEAQEGESKGGGFDLPSITTFAADASGDTSPLRTIQGERTELNWPMGMSLDVVHDELAVANYGNNSILIFRRTDQRNVAPVRVIRGSQTGILGPMGVSIDAKNDEMWITNYRDHSAAVFSRTADGNVAPKRVLRNARAGMPAVGFGNPGAVGYDSKRDQILVPN